MEVGDETRLDMKWLSVAYAVLLLGCAPTPVYKMPKAERSGEVAASGHIPRNIDEVLVELDRILGVEGRSEVMKSTEEEMINYHHGLGTWLRNNWLGGESQLLQFFNELGIQHRDDMSGIILDSYWRKLHGKPIDLEGQVQHYQDYWNKETKSRGR